MGRFEKFFRVVHPQPNAREIDGQSFSYRFIPGPKKRPPTLVIDFPVRPLPPLEVSRERWFHRLAKSMGLVLEVQNRDRNFDKSFFVDGGAPMMVRRLVEDSRFRELISTVFAADPKVMNLQLRKESLRLSVTQFKNKPDEAQPFIEAVQSPLSKLCTLLEAAAPEGIRQDSALGRGTSRGLMAVLVSILLLGLMAMILVNNFYRLLDPFGAFRTLLLWSAPLAFGLAWMLFTTFRRRYHAIQNFSGAMILLLIGWGPFSYGVPLCFNALLDDSPALMETYSVVERRSFKNKQKRSYNLYLRGKDSPIVRLACDAGTYNQAIPGRSAARLQLRQGALGYRWIADWWLDI